MELNTQLYSGSSPEFPDKPYVSHLHELSDYLERTILENGKVILLRDFNIHINRVDNMDAINFLDFLDSFGLIK